MKLKFNAFDACRKDPWAILPESLENILSITQRHLEGEDIDLDAVATKLGRPLENTRTVEVRDGVAVIPVSGPIFRFASMFTRISGATSVEDMATDFSEALDNPDVKAILFDVDSPGGQVAGIQEFAQQIYQSRGRKPMAVYTGDLMASAAVWIGTAVGKIYGSQTSRIGSIGVVAAFDDNREAKKRAGIREFKFISSKSPRKQPDPATKEGAKDIQSMVDQLADIFISDVARNREVSAETVEKKFGQGSVMMAADAVEAGLIDGISNYESVIESLVNESEPIQTTMARTSVEGRDNQKQEKSEMEEKTPKVEAAEPIKIDRDFLNANHSDLVDLIKAEGAKAESDRIKSVYDAKVPGHDAIVSSAMFDGKTTAADMALQILSAEKSVREKTATAIEKSAPKVVAQDDDAETANVETNKPAPKTEDDAIKASWEALDQEYRDKFIGGFDAYASVEKAIGSKRVKLRQERD